MLKVKFGFLTLGPVLCFAALSVAQNVSIVRTLPDLSETLKHQPAQQFIRGNSNGLTIQVDETKKYQEIEGFGASFTESSAWLLEAKLTPQKRKEVLRDLLDPEKGIGLNFLRQPLGASDFARSHYSYDDMPTGQRDPELKHFSTEHDAETIIPLLKEAVAIRPGVKIMVTPWSPPGWMKTKQSMIGGQLLDPEQKNFAGYLVKSLQAYQAAGIPVHYLSIQNEPLYETRDYPGMLMPASQQLAVIRDHLGPALAKSGLKTKILVYDHNWDHPEYPMEILSDPKASSYVAGTAFHCYGGDAAAQSTVQERFPNFGIWETECSGGSWQEENFLQVTAQLVIRSTRNWARSVVLWNMALDQKNGPNAGGCSTCRGVLTIDYSTNPTKVTPTADYYAMAHASKFASPGAHRIDSTDLGRNNLENVAFQNENGDISLLVLNNAATASTFYVRWHERVFPYTLPSKALVTFHWSAVTAKR